MAKKRKKTASVSAANAPAAHAEECDDAEEPEEAAASAEAGAGPGSAAAASEVGASAEVEDGKKRANVLVTGTPGTGKTTFSSALAAAAGLKHIEVSKMISEQRLYTEWDDDMNCSIFDEDMVCDALEPKVSAGGCVVDFHSAECLPEDWFDMVVVLRCDTSSLYSRLEERKYPEKKIRQNVEAEIFQTCLEEVREVYDGTNTEVVELQHDTRKQLEEGVLRVKQLVGGGPEGAPKPERKKKRRKLAAS
eukprot:TRINITY_DN14453_c0_g1_i1.p2 TRINITY_DN14453_c0_g1~~TRINITY_DN14453_c0_g1_i1.p2  ORF type:complete len:249 (+),score=68.52 TRINITY_DN14453_c0_g1_i1:69-815(+)